MSASNLNPCHICGSLDIELSSQSGGYYFACKGKCRHCGHTVESGSIEQPSQVQLETEWNKANDLEALIKAEEAKISVAQRRIAELRAKQGEPFVMQQQKATLNPMYAQVAFQALRAAMDHAVETAASVVDQRLGPDNNVSPAVRALKPVR